ncbi:MAG TPA: cell division protein FtsA [Candidatus Paceibacterota bacterium]|nr:cell division protein FtsA [Candidatus Paceibacterota bacterium]
MIRNISIGIDLGSETTRVIVGEFVTGEKNPKIVGAGEAPSGGMRHGYIVDPEAAVAGVRDALAMAEKSSGIKIKRAFVSVSGASLKSENSAGEAIVSKANGEVTTLDIQRALQDCEDNLSLNNKKVIQVYPLSFKLDGKEILGRAEGMRGTKLEAKALFITYSVQHLEDLLGVIARAGVETVDVIASPLALSNIVLSERQKIVGVALVDIGAETTSLSVFENGSLISIHTFAIGSSDITNDIALGFKIPLEKAESLKFGSSSAAGSKEEFPKKKLEEIIEARLCDIFESIENNLKKIKRAELLPAGIVFAGGGANVAKLEELSKSFLKLPAGIGSTEMFGSAKTKLRDPAWFTAIGVLMASGTDSGHSANSLFGLFGNLKSIMKSSLKQLMP